MTTCQLKRNGIRVKYIYYRYDERQLVKRGKAERNQITTRKWEFYWAWLCSIFFSLEYIAYIYNSCTFFFAFFMHFCLEFKIVQVSPTTHYILHKSVYFMAKKQMSYCRHKEIISVTRFDCIYSVLLQCQIIVCKYEQKMSTKTEKNLPIS